MNDWINELPLEDDMQIDLLVDNELNERQRQRLLAFLDSEPERWRLLALRFVEAQLVSTGVNEKSSIDVNRDDNFETTTADSIPYHPGTKKIASTYQKPHTHNRNHWKRTVVVLGLCLAFVVGLTLNGFLSDTDRGTAKINNLTNSSTTVVKTPTPKQHQKPDENKDIHNRVRPQSQNPANQNASLPLTRVRSSDKQEKWVRRRPLSHSDELALRQSGFDVQRRLSFRLVRISDQRHVIIPSQQVHIVRRNRNRI